MSRRILCQPCADKWKPHPEDVREGWKYRVVHLSIKKPAEHVVTVITDAGLMRSELPSILCDTCGDPISDGQTALAVTMWRDGEIMPWEDGFGTVIPVEAAKMVKVLEKGAT